MMLSNSVINKLNQLKLRTQLLGVLFTLASLTVILSSWIAYTQAIKVLKENFIIHTHTVLQRTRDDLLTKLNNVENTLNLISTDQRLQKLGNFPPSLANRELTKFFMDCINLNNYQLSTHSERNFTGNLIDELIFTNSQCTILSRREHFSVYGLESYLPPEIMANAKIAQGEVLWSPIFLNQLGAKMNSSLTGSAARAELNQIAVVKYVTHEKFKTGLGYLSASINLSRLAELVAGITLGKAGKVYLIDEESKVLAAQEQALIYQPLPLDLTCRQQLTTTKTGHAEGLFKQKKAFIHYLPVGLNQWKIVGIIENQEFTAQAAQVGNRILASSLLILLLLSITALMIAHRITKPLQQICEFLQQVTSGDLTLRTQATGSHEIEALATQVNQLIEWTGQFLEEIYEEQLFKRQVALQALQAQINPHFLYNTLDSISWTIQSGQREVATGLVTSLADFFRVSLSGGRDLVSLAEELKHVQSYLQIQKVRYQNCLDYLLDLPEEFYQVEIPKLTLQPLIENAIYHGIKPKIEGNGLICLSGSQLNPTTFRLTITDNGVGISATALATLNTALTTTNYTPATDGKGYSLLNINSRLKLYFGKEYGLHYRSKIGVGTKVEVLLPLQLSK